MIGERRMYPPPLGGRNERHHHGTIADRPFFVFGREPVLAKMPDGSLICTALTGGPREPDNDNAVTVVRSTDGGRTWDAPRLTEIPNVDTKITVVRAGGEILLIGNFARQHGWEDRTHLGIRRLIDDCHAEPLLALEPEEERFFYPHALVDEDERVLLVAYENATEHRLTRVDLDELGL